MLHASVIAARVEASMEALDRFFPPGWDRKIDPKILDISDGHCCAVAQLEGTWADGEK